MLSDHPHPGNDRSDATETADSTFDPEFAALLRELFENRIAFNQVIGLRVLDITPQRVTGSLDTRPDLIGHVTHQRLHGGVISASLDAMAGLAVMAAIGARHLDEPPLARAQRFAKLGTIDLRIDYLRPATGPSFRLGAEVIRLGSRVASVRMDFAAHDGRLLATGSAAYIVS